MQRNFQQILKELREERGLTQALLADKLNYTQGNISGWEKGSVEPKATALLAIANYFGVSIEYLLGVTDEFNLPIATPMVNAMGESYTAEERELVAKYRKLSPDLKEMLNGIIGTWTGETEPTPQKKALPKA